MSCYLVLYCDGCESQFGEFLPGAAARGAIRLRFKADDKRWNTSNKTDRDFCPECVAAKRHLKPEGARDAERTDAGEEGGRPGEAGGQDG